MLPFHLSLNFLDGAMGPQRLFFKAFEDLETKQARDSDTTILFFTLSNPCEGRKKEKKGSSSLHGWGRVVRGVASRARGPD